MTARLSCIKAEPQSGSASCFVIGDNSLFFVGPTLYAIEHQGKVKVRGDIDLPWNVQRRLNEWRPYVDQEVIDYYSFIVTLQDALLYGLTDVKSEIFANA